MIIGNDVWIGYGAAILSGITIGNGAVIAANTVVTKNVDPYTIVAGNPGSFIKKRFDDEIVNQLLQIKYWNWTIDKINSEVLSLCNTDVENFISKNKIINK